MKRKSMLTVLVTSAILGGSLTGWTHSQVANANLAQELRTADSTLAKTILFLSDINNHWAKTAIDKAVQAGYAKGYPDGTFKPNSNVTRAEFIKMTVEALQLPIEEQAGGVWYEPYVNAAKEAKLYATADYKNGTLSSAMTRKEMARVAARAVGESTTDDAKWMYLATKKGLISGIGKGKLGETENTTRAQSVAIIDRILTVNNGGSLPVDKYAVSSAEIAWHKTNIFTVMPEVFVDSKTPENVEELWKKDKMIITSKDGNWKGEVEAVIAIDLEDPNDPNLSLVPPISQLKAMNFTATSGEGIPISKNKNSYLIYYKSKIIHNKDPKNYSEFVKHVPFTINGTGIYTQNDRDAFYNKGILNTAARVFKDKPDDLPLYVFPKKGWGQDSYLSISTVTPSYSSYYMTRNELLRVSGPYK